MDVDQDMPVIVRHHGPDGGGGGGGVRIDATDAYNIAEIIRSAMKKEAISEHYLEQAARREAAAAMWMQHIATNVTSVAEELARITAAGHKLHGTDLPEPMELETGPPGPRGPPPPPGAAAAAAPLAAPPFYAGASSSAAPVTVSGAPINISIRTDRSPDQRTAKFMRIDTPSPERRAKETAARAEESARKATIDAEVAATRARDAQEREAKAREAELKAAARARSLEAKLQRAEEQVRAREAKSAERKVAEAREAEARAEAKRAREAERAKSEERKAEAKRVEAARKEAAAERARERAAQAETRKSSRSRTPGGSIRTPAAPVPTGSIDSRELRASTPDLTPEQEELLALVKKQYGIPEDMSIAEIVEASRRMMAMSAKKPRGARSSSGARSSTA